jgi:ankyrin repeat protein
MSGKSALMYACQKRNLTIVKELLCHGADVNAQSSTYDVGHHGNYTALMYACSRENAMSDSVRLEIVKELLRHGADVNMQNTRGQTALMKAACGGYLQIVSELLNHGANIDAREYKYGATALILACNHGQYEVVVKLVNEGADIYLEDCNGNTAVYQCKDNRNKDDRKIYEFLHRVMYQFMADIIPSDLLATVCQFV